MNKKTTLVIVIFIVIFSFVFASLWANGELKNKKGLTHMASSPQGTIFLTIEDYLLKVSSEGKLLSKMHLKNDLGIAERITDICVLNDGRFLIGLGNSHQIKAYSPDGSVINSYNVDHSDYDFSITSNTSNDLFYIALSNHQRGQIHVYDSSWQKVSSISDFINPDIPKPSTEDEGYEDEMADDVIQDRNDYFDPADIVYYDNRLYIADYRNRIVILNTDGNLDRIIPSPDKDVSQFVYTVRIARNGNMLYVVTYDDHHDHGAITAVNINTDERIHIGDVAIENSGSLYFKGYLHYPDIVARDGDILVIDQSAVKVRRLGHDGQSIGFFGDDSVQKTVDQIERPFLILRIVKFGSIGGALFALIGLVLVYKRTKKTSAIEKSLLLTPISAVRILGPEGHLRRKILLITVPGLGQLAAGKKLRAIPFILCYLVSLFFFSSSLYVFLKGVFFSIYYVIYTGAIFFCICAASARDALSLNESSLKPWEFRLKGILSRILIPLIPVLVGTTAQILWEIISRKDPALSFIMQDIIREIINYLKIGDEEFMTFAVLLPANTIIAWSLALCTMFICIGWEIGARGINLIIKGLFGLLIGILSAILMTIISTTYSGSGFYSPLVTGTLIGISLFVFFRRRISPLVMISSIAGAGLANAVKIYVTATLLRTMLGGTFDSSFLLGTSARINHTVSDIYFLHFTTLLVLSATKSHKAKINTG